MYVTPKTMSAIEDESERLGVSKAELMENAGARLCLFIMEEIYPNLDLSDGICILAGNGNNGGDGLALARNLSEAGLPVSVIMVCGEPKTPLAGNLYETIKQIPEIKILDNTGDLAAAYHIVAAAPLIVDCVFGTGYSADSKSVLRFAGAKAFLEFAAKSSAVKIAADIPSGGDALTGAYSFGVHYSYTISMGFDKVGLMKEPLCDFTGQVVTVDIGIPEGAVPPENIGIGEYAFDPKTVFCDRSDDCHKGDFGKALIVAGSSRYSGAAYFAAAGALKTGAGLVTLGCIKDVGDRVGAALPDVMYLPLPADKNGFISAAGGKELSRALDSRDFDVISFGCGIGDSPAAEEMLGAILSKPACTKIIDADGIKTLASNIDLLKKSSGEIIITPHAGELAALYGVTTAEAVRNREDYARSFAKEFGITVIAKGVPTYVCTKDGGSVAVKAGNPGLARGGSGDVLTGILTGLIANRSKQFAELGAAKSDVKSGTKSGAAATSATAKSGAVNSGEKSGDLQSVYDYLTETALTAVGLHGAAADKAAEKLTVHCMSARDVINFIPEVIKGC